MNISIVIPLFNEEESLPELHDWIKRVMDEHKYTYEILLLMMVVKINRGKLLSQLQQKITA